MYIYTVQKFVGWSNKLIEGSPRSLAKYTFNGKFSSSTIHTYIHTYIYTYVQKSTTLNSGDDFYTTLQAGYNLLLPSQTYLSHMEKLWNDTTLMQYTEYTHNASNARIIIH